MIAVPWQNPYTGEGLGVFKTSSAGQQQMLQKPTFSAGTELVETVWDQARLSSLVNQFGQRVAAYVVLRVFG